MKKKYLNLFLLSLTFIKENKQRAMLSVISVSVGLFSLLLVLVIGSSFIHSFSSDINKTKTIELDAYSSDFIESDTLLISDFVIQDINDSYDNVNIARSDPTFSANVDGQLTDIEFTDNVPVSQGQDFSNQTGNVIIINDLLVDNEYELNDEILIDNTFYKVIGFTNATFTKYILPTYKMNDFNYDQNNNKLILTFDSNLQNQTEITSQIIDYLNENIQNDRYKYEQFDLSELTSVLIKAAMFIGFLFGSIILLVSLIGIINMLFVSVNERKNEIAILRSQGLNKKDISVLFLIESFILITISTIISFILAYLTSLIILNIQDISVHVSILNVIIIIITVIIISCLSGFLPARKASNMNISEILI